MKLWRVLAVGALSAVALPASAQVVIGGSGAPSVEVNWSVLDSLGRQPTLPDLLKQDMTGTDPRPIPSQSKSKGVQYKPYKAGAQPYKAAPAKAQPKHAAAKPKASPVKPVSAKSERLADLVQSTHQAAPAPAPKAAPAPAPKAVADLDEVKPVEVPRSSSQPAIPAKAELPAPPEPTKPSALPGPQVSLPELPKPPASTPVAAAPAATPSSMRSR